MPGVVEQMRKAEVSPLAGLPAPKETLVDLARLEREYFARRPDLTDPDQMVRFGTSGHRGSPLSGAFTEAHILAITQAICDYRRIHGPDGPLYLGKDTHAVSEPAQQTALEVLAANGVNTVIQRGNLATPTPVISRTILRYNRGLKSRLADGIVVTPSHNPPEDGGFKYNPPNGGPADMDVTAWIQDRANELLRQANAGVKRVGYNSALRAATTSEEDFILPYVHDLAEVIDMEAIRGALLTLAVDPLGGAALHYWDPINSLYGLDVHVVNRELDPTFSFMTVDHDGRIRMDCSSPYAMARLVGLKDQYRVAFASDPDADRHGIVTPSSGLMNPNHYLAVAIRYLLTHRPAWNIEFCRRQNRRQQRDDRQSRRGDEPPAVGGPRWVQMVRTGTLQFLVLFRRGGERRRKLPAIRWLRLGHGQRRVDHGSARGRDNRPHGQGPRRALSRSDGRVWRALLRANRCARHSCAEGEIARPFTAMP